MRILIAEDERISRMALARQLQGWGHEVVSADDGQQAWEQFDRAPFDIVITDWEMPRMSGPELVRHIREKTGVAYTYVIILTSRSEKQDVIAGIEAGADDYLSKPFDKNELRVRLGAGERVVRLERALNQQNAELRDANEEIREGLRAAALVQQSMLPKGNIGTARVHAAWKYVPTDELAGDAIGLHLIDDRYLIAYVLDVSGHGVPAALLSVTAMQLLDPEPPQTSLLRNLAHPDSEWGTVQRAAKIASDLNRCFRAGEYDGRFLTMILCVLDTQTGQLNLASAGHPPPILLRNGQRIDLPDAGGIPISIMSDAEYDDAIVQLQPGDRLCLYSDGIMEQSGENGEQFGIARIVQLIQSTEGIAPDQAVGDVLAKFSRWANTTSYNDDLSLVVLEWNGPG
jgi:sigma-B regulation protein RsbU (phosphoserine phosphatase)